MIPVILSGGSGSRLWPLSRKQYPKQFLALTGDDTLFQQTIKRLAFDGMQAPLLVCNKEHRFIVQEQLEAQNLASQAILLEPFGRNTAPAEAIAAMKLVAEGRDELLLILPADHVIEDQRAFQQALALATNAAEKGEMVLFGIPASRPETGYGYIRASADAQLPEGVSRVQSFVEKPDEARAREFVAAGGYYWNSGMFLFRASRYLEELKKHDADIYDTCLLALERSQHDGDLVNIDAATFECCPDNSIVGGRFQVKHITVKPGARLSLQMHHHRAEHWIVVSGTAQVTCDDKTFLLTENQSTYIPIASVHRLANPGKIPLEIIEVQSGSYLGEDDIERLEDVYGRTAEPALQVVAGSR